MQSSATAEQTWRHDQLQPETHPRPLAVLVAGGKEPVGLHGGLSRRVLAVLVDWELGAAVDAEVGGHGEMDVDLTETGAR